MLFWDKCKSVDKDDTENARRLLAGEQGNGVRLECEVPVVRLPTRCSRASQVRSIIGGEAQ